MLRLIVLAFGAIQLILVGRLAIDLGMLPSTGAIADFVIPASEALAAPIKALVDAIGVDVAGVAGTGTTRPSSPPWWDGAPSRGWRS